MRFLLDENIAHAVGDALRAGGHDVEHVRETNRGVCDDVVAQQSRDGRRILITLDLDFGDLAIRDGQSALGVIILRSAFYARSPSELAIRLVQCVDDPTVTIEGHLTIIEPGRIRQRKLDQD